MNTNQLEVCVWDPTHSSTSSSPQRQYSPWIRGPPPHPELCQPMTRGCIIVTGQSDPRAGSGGAIWNRALFTLYAINHGRGEVLMEVTPQGPAEA